ncbi:hypothetical protein V6N11_058923 [Hibiscus sabdariffa]|uniref:Uncharacterized protein n=1 Tax=Hibiscus sabdariffa TaxID=183260 RepID=A0ABR2U5N5_9ROSI
MPRNFASHDLLKNFPPLFPMPLPTRPDESKDFASGLHRNSLRLQNKVASAGDMPLSFMFLHDTTIRVSRSFHERIAASRPSVANNEQPCRDKNFTLL